MTPLPGCQRPPGLFPRNPFPRHRPSRGHGSRIGVRRGRGRSPHPGDGDRYPRAGRGPRREGRPSISLPPHRLEGGGGREPQLRRQEVEGDGGGPPDGSEGVLQRDDDHRRRPPLFKAHLRREGADRLRLGLSQPPPGLQDRDRSRTCDGPGHLPLPPAPGEAPGRLPRLRPPPPRLPGGAALLRPVQRPGRGGTVIGGPDGKAQEGGMEPDEVQPPPEGGGSVLPLGGGRGRPGVVSPAQDAGDRHSGTRRRQEGVPGDPPSRDGKEGPGRRRPPHRRPSKGDRRGGG